MSIVLEFIDDAATFLDVAGMHLAAHPVESTVVGSVAARELRDGKGEPHPDAPPQWWLVVRDGSGAVVGVGMRTMPLPPFTPYLLSMPDDAALEIARVLGERGERVEAVNGALPATRLCAEAIAAADGRQVRVAEEMRLNELGTLVTPPRRPPGALRVADEGDFGVVLEWFTGFGAAAAAQAGRPDAHPSEFETADATMARVRAGDVYLWVVDGVPVHITGINPAVFGVARIGPVFTPDDHRGHGYAAAAVAEVSAILQAQGSRVCLFTDVANRISNDLYARLGYEPVVDMANLVIAG